MSRLRMIPWLAGAGWSLALVACTSPVVGDPCPVPDNATPEQRSAAIKKCFGQINDDSFPARIQKDVDILFLIDNSPSMSPKQQALAQNIPAFIQKIDATGANYHVGIATSDIGSNTMPGVTWGGSIGSCDTFEGDDGVLQNMACKSRSNVTGEARNACNTLCPDPKFVPTDGRRYISKIEGVTNVPPDLRMDPMTGQMVDYGPINAFKCMALVGDGGCGIEGQFEGAKRALDGHRAENAGFLRSNAALAVIFITDEDDCSVQLSRRAENDPNNTRDCATPDQNASYQCYGVDYRCLARSIQCNEPMNTPGVKTNCSERANNYLETVDKYYRFFSSLRAPNRLLISGIWTLPSVDMNGRVEVANSSMGTTTQFLNRASGAGASCVYASDPNVFGQAQLRLSKFARQFKDGNGDPSSVEVSICDINNYPLALDTIAKAILKILPVACLPALPKQQNGKPICLVGDVDETVSGASPDVLFPACSATCCDGWANASKPNPTDPAVVAACSAETTDACYCAVSSKVGQCPGTAVAGVWRKGGAVAPPGKVVGFKCASGG